MAYIPETLVHAFQAVYDVEAHNEMPYMLTRDSTQPKAAFPSTRWSMIRRAGEAGASEKKEAMGQLLVVYTPAIRAHLIWERKVPRQEVEDVIQGFLVSQVLMNDLIAKAQKERGKFRTFLLTSLEYYIVSEFRKQNAKKRKPTGPVVSITLVDPPSKRFRPDGVFEVEWARLVIKQTIDRLREECFQSGRQDIWGVFEDRLYLPLFEQQPSPSYTQLVSKYQLKSPSHASNLLLTAKRMFARILRSIIGEYAIHDPQEVDEEIADLKNILAKMGSLDAD